MARWTVLLGALVTVDGVWRTTGTLLPLRPRDADEVTDLAREMLDAIVAEMSGEQLDRHRDRRSPSLTAT